MVKFLVDLPFELQSMVLSYLNLMDVIILTEVPELKTAILQRLPKDKIVITEYLNSSDRGRDNAYSLSNTADYATYNTINYKKERHLKLLTDFLRSNDLIEPIKTLSVEHLTKHNNVADLFENYLNGWNDSWCDTVEIRNLMFQNVIINVPWGKRKLLSDAFCKSCEKLFIDPEDIIKLDMDMLQASDPSAIDSQLKFLEYCFDTGVGISNDTIDISAVRDTAVHSNGELLMNVLGQYRPFIWNTDLPLTEELKALDSPVSHTDEGISFKGITLFTKLEQVKISLQPTSARAPDDRHFPNEQLQKLVNLRELKLQHFLDSSFNLTLPNLRKLDIEGYGLHSVDLINVPRLEDLKVIQIQNSANDNSFLQIYNMPSTIKKIYLYDSGNKMVFNSIVDPEKSYNSLERLYLEGLAPLDDFPSFIDIFPALKSLDINLQDNKIDSVVFAEKLPQSIEDLCLTNGDFKNTQLDFSALPHLASLGILFSALTTSNTCWGDSIKTLKLFDVHFQDENFVIGDNSLRQLQHLNLRSVSFTECNLIFSPGSLLQTLFMKDVDLHKENMCQNLQFLEIFEEYPDYSRTLCMDFRYSNPEEYDTLGNTFRFGEVVTANGSDTAAMGVYMRLKEKYGIKSDLLVFLSDMDA